VPQRHHSFFELVFEEKTAKKIGVKVSKNLGVKFDIKIGGDIIC